MDVPLFELDGTEADRVELPEVFETEYRPDLIRRAFVVTQANSTQPKGADPLAGRRTSAESFGAGRGIAMVPRSNNRGRRVPQTVGGRRAHPPKAEADTSKAMNKHERQLANRSAIAATADGELVRERGHRVSEEMAYPIVIDDAFEELNKTKDVVEALEALGLGDDLERAERNRKRRAGRGTTRGRPNRQPTSVLVVTSSEVGPSRGARNIPGVDVATAIDVGVSELAPGGHPGRLTLFTASALEEVSER